MLAAVGCPVKKLERVAMGPVKLKGLAVGEWRELSRVEVQRLRQAVDKGGKKPGNAAKKKAGKKTTKKTTKKVTKKPRRTREGGR